MYRPLLGSDPAVICVEGLECMNDDPTAVNVLFAKIFLSDGSDRSVSCVGKIRITIFLTCVSSHYNIATFSFVFG